MRKWLLFLWPALLCAQQPWTGILSSSRASTWGNAGLQATLPSGETTVNPWTPPTRTQCGATIASGASAATINTALSTCGSGNFVLLGPGTFNLSGTNITLGAQNGVTLRGSGADQTTIVTGASNQITFKNSGASETSITWTAGFAAGTTTPTVGSVALGQLLRMSALGETFDPGGPYVCAVVNICSQQNGAHAQYQVVRVTNTTPVTIDPPLYLSFDVPLNTQSIIKYGSISNSNGLEDLTVDCTAQTTTDCIGMTYSQNSWVKGVRILGVNVGGEQLGLKATKNNLIMNNYLYANVVPNSNVENITDDTGSDNLFLNNICQASFGCFYIKGPVTSDVYAYNLSRDGSGSKISGGHKSMNNIFVTHDVSDMLLFEGNQFGGAQEDMIHSTHSLDTYFRNMIFGNDPPYVLDDRVTPLSFEGYARLMNVVGNVLGSGLQSKYKATPANPGGSPIYDLGQFSAFSGGYQPLDVLADPMRMSFGNYDAFTGAVRWCGNSSNTGWSTTCASTSEVPVGLNTATGFTQNIGTGNGATTTFSGTMSNTPLVTGAQIVVAGSVFGYDDLGGHITGTGISSGTITYSSGAVSVTFSSAPANGVAVTVNYVQQTASASPFRNAVPATQTFPPSFLPAMPSSAHPTGGTGLSWWKVCTNYPTCTTFQTQPYPPIGPDVTGGNLTAGHGYDIPAQVAWKNLPVDTAQQSVFSITASSWSAGTETINVVINSTWFPYGEFRILSGPCAGTFQMTSSSATQVSYALASNPGANACNGTNNLAWPDIRAFNENVYQTDSASGTATLSVTCPSTCTSIAFGSVAVGSSLNSSTITLTNTGTATLTGLSSSSWLSDTNDYQIISNTCSSTIGAGGNCTFAVRFIPQSVASFPATLTFTSNATNSPTVVNLSGTGVPPVAATPTFSPQAGTYSNSLAVNILDASPGAVICYTYTASPAPATDGASGCTTGTLFSVPISVSGTTNFFAVAGGTGYTDSAVATGTYITTATGLARSVFAKLN